MELATFLGAIRTTKKVIWFWLFGLVALMAILTFVQPLKYGANTQMLIVQNFGGTVDPYTVSRSNQYLSSTLAAVVTSQSFFNETLNSGFDIDRTYFPTDTRKQVRLWQKTVIARSIGDTGIIQIQVYHTDRDQAVQIARAINYTLKTKNGQYQGSGELTIKVLDEPVASIWPVKPNILTNMTIAVVLGLVAGLAHVYARASGLLKDSVKLEVKLVKVAAPKDEPAVSVPAFETLEVVSPPAMAPEAAPAAAEQADPRPPTSVRAPAAEEPRLGSVIVEDDYRQPATSGPAAGHQTAKSIEDIVGPGDIKNVF